MRHKNGCISFTRSFFSICICNIGKVAYSGLVPTQQHPRTLQLSVSTPIEKIRLFSALPPAPQHPSLLWLLTFISLTFVSPFPYCLQCPLVYGTVYMQAVDAEQPKCSLLVFQDSGFISPWCVSRKEAFMIYSEFPRTTVPPYLTNQISPFPDAGSAPRPEYTKHKPKVLI